MSRDEYISQVVKRAPEPSPNQIATIRAAFDRADNAGEVKR